MSKEYTVDLLADLIRNAPNLGASVCLLVGAGVSVSAGIPDANGIMHDLRLRYPKIMQGAQSKTYTGCMSLLPDGFRRQEIRSFINRSCLNKSARAIALLAREQYINRILTTNFDKLVEQALMMYGITPSVHDFAASQHFITGEATGLRLFYLHGKGDGFLLLNTKEQINSLTDQLNQLFEDTNVKRTLIVVGYSGSDEPVFKAITRIKKYEYGLYWVGYQNKWPSNRVKEIILSREDAYFVKAQNSDTFFEQLLSALNLSLESSLRPKTTVKLEEIDQLLTSQGRIEAADIFGIKTDEVIPWAFRIFHQRTGEIYLHRVFIRLSDYKIIEQELKSNPALNILRTIIEKRGAVLSPSKSHRMFPTLIGSDASVFDNLDLAEKPALLHAQVSYEKIENVDGFSTSVSQLQPIEFLLTKYTTPISIYGYLLDRTPKKGYSYSKVAEDLLNTENDRNEVSDASREFFQPFSRLSMHLAENHNSQTIPYSETPQKLLRIAIVPENHCNYLCTFCCRSDKNKTESDVSYLSPKLCAVLAKAAVQSGCQRIMLTGGEPFLRNQKELLESVKLIAKVKEIEDFWICTNGAFLEKKICTELYKRGLKKIVVTIAAEKEEKYKMYSRQSEFKLSDVLERIRAIIEIGFQVRVDIPLTRDGIKNNIELLTLIEKAKPFGVNQFSYFQLHKTPNNADVFDNLFVPQDIVTWELYHDNSLQVVTKDNGQKVFVNDNSVEVIIPTRIQPSKENCLNRKCGNQCQGVYAAYATANKQGDLEIQFCHRRQEDNVKIFINSGDNQPKVKELSKYFTDQVWSWAYD